MYRILDTNHVRNETTGEVIPLVSGNREYAEYLAWLDDGNEPLPAPEPSLEDVQTQQIAIINAAFEAAAEALTAGYPATERLTWPVQQAEAQAWAANAAAPTPYLDGLAAARGITPEEMRQLTLDQVNLFLAASQQLVGLRQRLRDQINAAETIEDARAVVWPNPET